MFRFYFLHKTLFNKNIYGWTQRKLQQSWSKRMTYFNQLCDGLKQIQHTVQVGQLLSWVTDPVINAMPVSSQNISLTSCRPTAAQKPLEHEVKGTRRSFLNGGCQRPPLFAMTVTYYINERNDWMSNMAIVFPAPYLVLIRSVFNSIWLCNESPFFLLVS